MSVAAHKPREDYDLSDCERIATGLIVCVEGLRDRQISGKAAHVCAEMLLKQLDELHVPPFKSWDRDHALVEPARLLAIVTIRWAALSELQSCDGDFLVSKAWRKIALDFLDLVQTTMAREAGRMP